MKSVKVFVLVLVALVSITLIVYQLMLRPVTLGAERDWVDYASLAIGAGGLLTSIIGLTRSKK